jgi:large subunit ribosomal protein L1
MAKLSKRFKAINDQYDRSQAYSLDKALTMAKDFSKVKFDESVDVSVNLGIDARKSDQMIRGATVLPAGTGKTMRVAVFTQGDNVDTATAAGADVVGMDELAQQMKDGDIAFDVVIASPDAMRVVGQLGTLLGPRGLMPNPKVGTVTTDVAKAVTNAKSGQVRYRTDKAGILQCTIGKASFDVDSLKNNLDALLADLLKAKPAAAKGVFFKKITISTTMGPGITVDQASLEK